MHFANLPEWLEWLKKLHNTDMELGLERVSRVAKQLKVDTLPFPLVTIGGTNGKGSCVAGLEAIYKASGYRVGAFTSPYLFRHNETVRLQGHEVDDETFCNAFESIEQARGDISLTVFEFNTLAALLIFQRAELDVCLLEVGLGGRLDAVNIVDTSLALITSIGIDHADVLGHTRDEIAREKAGIFRPGMPVVCGDPQPPASLITCANQLHAPLFIQGQQFHFEKQNDTWTWWSKKNHLENLPLTPLFLPNMASVLMVIEVLTEKLPVSLEAIHQGLASVELPGRIQVIPGEVTKIFDVSHNPPAAQLLANYLKKKIKAKKIRAVFSMLADKDILGTLLVMKDNVDEWYTAALPAERGASLDAIAYCFRKAGIIDVSQFDSIAKAYQAALRDSTAGDCVIVFGSFYTVAETLCSLSS